MGIRSDLAARARQGERRVGLLDADVHVLALKFQAAIAEHRARQEAGLEQHLKAVADAEHRTTAPGERAKPRA